MLTTVRVEELEKIKNNWDSYIVLVRSFVDPEKLDTFAEVLFLGRGVLNEQPYILSKNEIEINIKTLTEFFNRLFDENGILSTTADISRGVKDTNKTICYKPDGTLIDEHIRKLMTMTKHLLSAYRCFLSFMEMTVNSEANK